jgi:hypothetical protein
VKAVVPRNTIKWHRAGYTAGFLCRGKSGSSGRVPFYETVLSFCVNLRKINWQKNGNLYLFLLIFHSPPADCCSWIINDRV